MQQQSETMRAERKEQDFVRLPGLFRRWELEQVIEVGTDFYVEDAGRSADGTPLVAIYHRAHPVPGQ